MIQSILLLPFWVLILLVSQSPTSTAQINDPFPPQDVTTYIDLGCNPDIRSVIPRPRDPAHLSDMKKRLDPENCGVRIEWLGDERKKDGCYYSLIRKYQITLCNGESYILLQIYNWIVDKQPPKIKCPENVDLGCNPPFIPAPEPEKLDVTDNCCLDTVYWLQDIIVTSEDCKQVRLRQYVAIDCCGNRAICEQRITWISDATPPEIVKCPEGKDLGCIPDFNVRKDLPKPSPRDVEAKDNCSNVKVTWELSDITVVGCEYSISYVYIVTDRCGNQSQCLQTFTWTVDNEPPKVDCQDLFLGCNPDPGDIPSISDIPVTDNCGAVTIESPASSIQMEGCMTIITQSFTAVDQCGNETKCERRIRYTTDTIPPEIDCNDLDLGCNPDYIPTVFDIPVKDNCSEVEIINPISSIIQDGCKFMITQTITAVDRCGNRSTCTRTITYIKDEEAPEVLRCDRTIDLGCITSKDEIPPPLPAPIVITDNCSEVDVEVVDKVLKESDCRGKMIYYYKISDRCGNMTRCKITYTWIQDTVPPVVDCPEEVDLGCNPSSIPGIDASRIKVKDNCGIADTFYAIADYFPDGCVYRVGYLYTFIDHCGNQSSCLEVFRWTHDYDPPTIVQCPPDIDLGCWDQNGPNELPPPDMDAFIAEDECGEVTKSYQNGFDIVINPEFCIASRVRRYIATDACGNQSECWQTYTWTYDVTPPNIIQCAPDLDLGCISDLDDVPGPDNSDDVIAVDNCTNITTRWLSGEANINECEWEYRYWYSVEDECGNESTCIQTIEFTYVDPEAPTLQIPEDMTVFCQVPEPPDYSGVCANESLELLFEFDNGCEDNNCTVYRYWLLTTCDGERIFGVQEITVNCSITGGSLSISEDHGNQDSIKPVAGSSDNKVITEGKPQESRNPRFNLERSDPVQMILYPNPATNSITLTLDDGEPILSNVRIFIYDQYGRVVKHMEPDHRIEKYEVGINELPGGMYFVELISEDNRRWNKPFVKLE